MSVLENIQVIHYLSTSKQDRRTTFAKLEKRREHCLKYSEWSPAHWPELPWDRTQVRMEIPGPIIEICIDRAGSDLARERHEVRTSSSPLAYTDF